MVSRPAAVPHPIDAPGTDEHTWAAWPRLDALPDARTTALSGVQAPW